MIWCYSKEINSRTHPSSHFPLGCTDLGSAQSSLVVPFRLAHYLEIEAYKQKLLSEDLSTSQQYKALPKHRTSSALPPLLPPPFFPLSVKPSKNKRAGAADEDEENNTEPIMLRGWSTYGSPPPPPPSLYLSPPCNYFPFLSDKTKL